jgi:hypothetical protein
MTEATAVRLVRWWTRVYTSVLPPDLRASRQAEIESDLWESLADPGAARDIVSRLLFGVVDDVAWSVEHMSTGTRASAWWSLGSLLTLTMSIAWVLYAPQSAAMRESVWALPVAETCHLLGLIGLVGLQGALALRLTGHAFADIPVRTLLRHATPWTIAFSAVTLASGLALYAAEPSQFANNVMFRAKLVALALVVVNVWFIHAVALRGVEQWEPAAALPGRARASGYVALVLWSVVIVAGRLTAFIGQL